MEYDDIITTPRAHADLVDHLVAEFPGGGHIAPHLAQGPFSVLLTSANHGPKTPDTVTKALAAFTHRNVLMTDVGWSRHRRVRLYVVPAFVAHLVDWFADSTKNEMTDLVYRVFTDHVGEPTHELPTQADIAALLPSMYFAVSCPEVTEPARRFGEAGHLDRLHDLFEGLHRDRIDELTYGPAADVITYMGALEAAQFA